MIEGLLFLARAENTDIQPDCTLFDPVHEVSSVLEYYEALAAEKNITIQCEGSGNVYADPLLFRRAITNILSNAFRYSHPGSVIRISIHEENDHSLTVCIQDNGIGIEASELHNIFERFYRTPGAKQQDNRGSGLGLAIAKSIMDLHGGIIDVQSELGIGTTVTFKFPSR
jgi:two-component system heavy metal sensor histidine kinase CusS